MNGQLALAVLCGFVLGSGLAMMLFRVPWLRKPTFGDRIEPQLRVVASNSKLLIRDEAAPALFGPAERLLRILLRDGTGFLGRFKTGYSALALRLERAGRAQAPIEFRAEQLICAGIGFAASASVVAFLSIRHPFNPLLSVIACLGAATFGYALRDYLLSRRIRRRERRLLNEFPALAELMALAVSAGESAAAALERVCRSSRGELAQEFGRVMVRTRSGMPLTEALAEFSHRTNVAPLVRFTDGLIVAVQRGTPLAEVLRAQAQDVRDMSKRELMEAAGKKEIGMMIPLVFGILPLTVVFAAFPGLQLLQFGL